MVMMALHFSLGEKILFKEKMPLLIPCDVREIMLNVYLRKEMNQSVAQVNKRQEQRRLQLSKHKESF